MSLSHPMEKGNREDSLLKILGLDIGGEVPMNDQRSDVVSGAGTGARHLLD